MGITGRWAAVLSAMAMLVLAAALSACGGSEETTTVTETAAEVEPASEPEPDPKPKPEPANERFEQAGYSIAIPRGWEQTESDADQGGFLRSEWAGPGDVTLSVDVSAGEYLAAAQKAADVRSIVAAETADYREVSYRERELAGEDAVEWVFESEGERRIDYFIGACQSGYAILGSAPKQDFEANGLIFEEAASSIRFDCDSLGSTPPPEESVSEEATADCGMLESPLRYAIQVTAATPAAAKQACADDVATIVQTALIDGVKESKPTSVGDFSCVAEVSGDTASGGQKIICSSPTAGFEIVATYAGA